MKLAYSSNAYMKFPIADAVQRVAGLGFGGVELMADTPHLWPATTADEDIDKLRTQLDRLDLKISNINAFMMNAVQDFWHPSWIEPDETFRRKRLDHTIGALSLAHKIGAPCITTEPGGPLEPGMSREWAMDVFADGLNEALKHAENQQVLLLVEPEPGLLIENADQFLELADRVDSPMFGHNFDIGHYYCVGDPLPETVLRLQHLTRHYHIEDIASSRVHEHLIPGRGAIDFQEAFNAIKLTEYRDWITIELYPYIDDPDQAGNEARQYLLPLMQP